MDSQQYRKVKEVFLAVVHRPVEEQDRAIAELCGDDPEMRAEVQSLLESHRKADDIAGDGTGGDESVPAERTAADVLGPLASGDARTTIKARFAPGVVVDERYRIVSLLGIGGMGEVYRADDLTLEQVVALKFLPKAYASDKQWLDRLHAEVRLSRQVTHPNVCRIFDIGQVDGEQFITMEYVDGEHLGSLLRRIGRLPSDKAIQIARQLCAGLAAAHEKGVLHRDLKPANVMIDGRGQVRITDFGISAPIVPGEEAPSTAAGTPAYMAPEQFARGQASVLSDIYSLGLVLYELFTGRQAFSGRSVLDYARLHRETAPTDPSTIIGDMDPLVERVILRCLEKDPTRRPPSARAVAAALPGGDPLAAALAAGETPTPEMVAAAGGSLPMTVRRGAILLALTLAGLVAVVLLSGKAYLVPHMPLDKPPDVLADKSRAVLAAAGFADQLPSQAMGFSLDDQYVAWVQANDQTPDRWAKLAAVRPGAGLFWYRESPSYMVSRDDFGAVTLDEPARSVPGMRTVVLDPQGRLKRLEILPQSNSENSGNATKPDIQGIFGLAGLDFANFKIATPAAAPPMFADSVYAWNGFYPENPDQKVAVEAATLSGKVVYFRLSEILGNQSGASTADSVPDPRANNILLQVLILAVTGCAVLLAWHNVRVGRVDSGGAHKLSASFLVLGILIWLLFSNHVPQLFLEINAFFRVLGFIMVPAGIVWMFYLALEPYVRRIWPETVISWNRLLSGKIGDPLVASHVLIGLAIASAVTILDEIGNLLPIMTGHAQPISNINVVLRYLARDNAAGTALRSLWLGLYVGLLCLLVLVLFQLLLRRRWAAEGAFVLVVVAVNSFGQEISGVRLLGSAIFAGFVLLLLVRYGLVAALAAFWAIFLLRNVPVTNDMSIWYAVQTRFALGLLVAVAVAAATAATRSWRGWGQRAA
jgi:serine/threonine-protein kinase